MKCKTCNTKLIDAHAENYVSTGSPTRTHSVMAAWCTKCRRSREWRVHFLDNGRIESLEVTQ